MFTENFPSFFRLWNPESGKNLNVESGILGWESGIPLKESGIARMIKIQNPSFTDKYWNPVPRIRNTRRGIQNPRLSWIPLYGTTHCKGQIQVENFFNEGNDQVQV